MRWRFETTPQRGYTSSTAKAVPLPLKGKAFCPRDVPVRYMTPLLNEDTVGIPGTTGNAPLSVFLFCPVKNKISHPMH
jgi:hypothetical protein